MAVIVIQMVKDGIQAYINRDVALARSLDKTDDHVDNLFKRVMTEQIELTQKDSHYAGHSVMLIMIAKYFERIGDHAVNIGEWVEYAITGKHPKRGII
jgi:phosphate transport system protein